MTSILNSEKSASSSAPLAQCIPPPFVSHGHKNAAYPLIKVSLFDEAYSSKISIYSSDSNLVISASSNSASCLPVLPSPNST